MERKKTISVLTALSTLLATSGCTVTIDDDIVKDLSITQDEDGNITIGKKDKNETTLPIVTTTETTSSVTTSTEKTTYTTALTGTTTYKTTVTSGTTESLKPRTTATHEQRGPVPTESTTTTTVAATTIPTTTVKSNDTIIEPEYAKKDIEEKISYDGYKIVLGREYTVQAISGTISGSGEGLYSIIYNYYGKYSKKLESIIMKKNDLKETFVLANTKLDLPTVILYKGNSIAEVSQATRIYEEEIEEYNDQKGKDYIVKVLENTNEFTDMYGQRNVILGDVVVIADTVTKFGENTYLLLHKTNDGHNFVEYMELNGKQATINAFASDVAYMAPYGVICINEGYKYSLKVSGHNPEEYNTKIYKFKDLYEYINKEDKKILVAPVQLENIPEGYEYSKTIGGYQKTK